MVVSQDTMVALLEIAPLASDECVSLKRAKLMFSWMLPPGGLKVMLMR